MQRILFSCAALIATLSPFAGAVRLDATVGLEALMPEREIKEVSTETNMLAQEFEGACDSGSNPNCGDEDNP